MEVVNSCASEQGTYEGMRNVQLHIRLRPGREPIHRLRKNGPVELRHWST